MKTWFGIGNPSQEKKKERFKGRKLFQEYIKICVRTMKRSTGALSKHEKAQTQKRVPKTKKIQGRGRNTRGGEGVRTSMTTLLEGGSKTAGTKTNWSTRIIVRMTDEKGKRGKSIKREPLPRP